MLWIQEKTEKEEVRIKKVKGISNPADMMTNSVNKEKLETYMVMTMQKVAVGRAKESLKVKEPGTLDYESNDTAAKKGDMSSTVGGHSDRSKATDPGRKQ